MVIPLVVTLLLLGPAEPQQKPAQPILPVFESLANRIQALGMGDFLYGFRSPSAEVAEFEVLLEQGNHAASDFRPLLKHSNPKVRTLALIAMYSLEDPKVLPDIFPLVRDEAQTFPGFVPTASLAVASGLVRKERQTVGEVATGILNKYLESGGYFYGPNGSENSEEPGFAQYWKTHGGRSNAAGWWMVRLSRAGHGTKPTPPDRIASIRKVRAGIDRLAEPDRALTLLWLRDEFGADALASDEELVRLLQQIGREALLKVLQRKPPTDDPDLQPRPLSSYSHGRMCIFILQHAKELLLPSDAKAVLDQETWELDFRKNGVDPLLSPWWAIAAAELEPGNAVTTIESAYTRFSGQYDGAHRLELGEALWRLGGEAHAARVVDWLYRELPRPPLTTWGISNSLDRLLNQAGRDNRMLARTVIEEPRFDELNWRSLEVLAKDLNRSSGQEWISRQELESAWSPSGIDFFMKDASQALKTYPKENGALVDTLARWRQILREHKPK